jgi:hypothetical protein
LRLVHAKELEVDGGGYTVGLRNSKISPKFILHAGKNRDVLWLLDKATCLNRKSILNPNVLYVDNGSCVDGRDGRVSDETDYQQG